MDKKSDRSLGLLLVVVLVVAVHACAPRRVQVYDTAAGARGDVVQQAIGVLGRPYKNGAKGPDSFDCSGLIHYVYKRVSVTLPVTAEQQMGAGLDVPPANILPGDLVFFKIKKDFHAGIMLNKKDFIHSSKTKGVCVDSIDSTYWKRSILCFRSILQY